MLTYGNHVGLHAEEIAVTGEQLGNSRRRSPTSPSSTPRSPWTNNSLATGLGEVMSER